MSRITVRRIDVLPVVAVGQTWLFGRARVRVVSVVVERGREWIDVGPVDSIGTVRAVKRLTFEEFTRQITAWDAKLETQK